MSAKNLFIACGLHANSITEQAAEELLAYNREQNRGLWTRAKERGEHVPLWSKALTDEGDMMRLDRWVKGNIAHGAKTLRIEPVNGLGGLDWFPISLVVVAGFYAVRSAGGLVAHRI
jgi:hypothetical protein